MRNSEMRRVSVADLVGAFAMFSVSVLFVAWALKVLVETGNRDAWSWSAIESIGTWFAGVGTLIAVVVSLYLARRSDRKVDSKDYLRGRMTALRYIGKLVEVKSELIFFKTWAATKCAGLRLVVDRVSDGTVIHRLAALQLDVPFDDLVMLAPIEQNFAERLHLLSLQLKICSGDAVPLKSVIDLIDSPDGAKGSEIEQEYLKHLEQLSATLILHTDDALALLDPLLERCGRFAYTPKHSPYR
ncbi:hypothetical protein [Burkholderia contaminans]|uniref:hypothetical protein n=1 Tax=Burkholderia contaminans TaxID=488447 RepID=UPI00158928E5|nr:hypothetical protein [Burkholderia contaminans]